MSTSIENLRLKFPNTEHILFRDFSLSIKEGEKVLLLGPSGCGKSTLLQVMSGLIPNTLNVPMIAENIQIPNKWAYVFQDPDSQFCMPYVDEELAFVLENECVPRELMREKIEALLQLVDLHLPDIHTPIQQLSGGMKQKVALASAFALEPDVLFLDEPTALLDVEATKMIWETVTKLAKDKTVIIVEHKIEHMMDFVDRIILLNHSGEMIADGETSHIFSEFHSYLKEYGVFYPNAWAEADLPFRPVSPLVEERLRLKDFTAYRKKAVVSIEEVVVYAGEWVAITGKNGAGKSTLLEAIYRLHKTTGMCVVNGNDKKPHDTALVFQNPEFQFITNRVDEEIAYSLRLNGDKNIETKVDALLEQFGLMNHRSNHPYELSIGQKRRLSVAASIVGGQTLILLDEPTFGQDAKNTFQLIQLIEHYRENGAAIVMITHDYELINRVATRVWTIENGQLISDKKREPTPILSS